MNTICTKCGKTINRLSKSETYIDVCNSCYKKDYYLRNKARLDANSKAHFERTKKVHHGVKECAYCSKSFTPKHASAQTCSKSCSDKLWRLNNHQHTVQYHREKYNHDLQRKIATCLRSRLNKALKGSYKSLSTIESLGCSTADLIIHLESKFQAEMSWDNYGRKVGIKCWEIDHIVPLSSFDLSDPEQLKKACHYSNLQPLWWNENLSKGSKV